MKTVWKFVIPIGDPVTIEMDAGAKVIHVDKQHEWDLPLVTIWVEVYRVPIRLVSRTFQVFGTNHDLPVGSTHLGSVVVAGGELVWHLYELINEGVPVDSVR